MTAAWQPPRTATKHQIWMSMPRRSVKGYRSKMPFTLLVLIPVVLHSLNLPYVVSINIEFQDGIAGKLVHSVSGTRTFCDIRGE